MRRTLVSLTRIIMTATVLTCVGCSNSNTTTEARKTSVEGHEQAISTDDPQSESIGFDDWKNKASTLCTEASTQFDQMAEEIPPSEATDDEILQIMRDYVSVLDGLEKDLEALGTPTSSSDSLSRSIQDRTRSFIDALDDLAQVTADGITGPDEEVEAVNEMYFASFDAFGHAAETVGIPCDLTSPVNRNVSAPMAQCETDRVTLRTAALAFEASTGSPAGTKDDVLAWLKEWPEGWDFIDGEIVPVPGSACDEITD